MRRGKKEIVLGVMAVGLTGTWACQNRQEQPAQGAKSEAGLARTGRSSPLRERSLKPTHSTGRSCRSMSRITRLQPNSMPGRPTRRHASR
jgi:hypothetical protein